MKAIALEQFGGPGVLKEMDLPKPAPASGEVVVRVKAAGVNPVDWKVREGWLKDMFPHGFPLIPGWDMAGVIDEIGEGVTDLSPGDEVYAYARKPTVQHGAYAAFVALEARHVAHKPAALSFEEAASVPLAALTAYQALFDAAKLQPGERVLVHAAAGGVGSFAVQLAHEAGAEVWGTASEPNHDFIRSLGTDHPIDYRRGSFVDAIKDTVPEGVDVIFDCVGGPTLDASPEALKEGGRLISIVDPATVQRFAEQGLQAHFVFVEPNAGQLDRLRDMIEHDTLTTHVSAVLPLEEAAKAHELIETQHTRGKIVLRVTA